MKSQNNPLENEKPDEIRKQGLRPVVVACILHDKKVLFVFKRDFNLWQLPQGGIEPFETPREAVKRELNEELGSFAENIDYASFKIIGSDVVEFPKENQGQRDLITREGESIYMKGKKYYLAKMNTTDKNIEINESEFEKYRWVSLEESDNLVRHIYQKGKKRITQKALALLAQKNEL